MNISVPEYKDIMYLMHLLDNKYDALNGKGDFKLAYSNSALRFSVHTLGINIYGEHFPIALVQLMNIGHEFHMTGYCTEGDYNLHKEDTIIVSGDEQFIVEGDQYLYEDEFNFMTQLQIKDNDFLKVVQTQAALMRESFLNFNSIKVSSTMLGYYRMDIPQIIKIVEDSDYVKSIGND